MAETEDAPTLFAFVLLEAFSLLAFAATLEPLRHANRLSGRRLYAWRTLTETGAPARPSCGLEIAVDGPLADLPRGAQVVVCGGLDVQAATTPRLLAWLRREARRGVRMGAVSTGAHALARAGLLDGRRCTIHWENRDGFAEAFPEVDLSDGLFVRDRELITAAGGLAGADLMLRLIEEAHGPDLAAAVADQMVCAGRRGDREAQRPGAASRVDGRHPRLGQVIAVMHAHLEEPISAADLAEAAGMSTRQLERLFRRHLDRSPKRYYLELRLEKARRLLLQTEMSVIEVALACGFTSPSHFSKCYRARYQRTPYRERGVTAGG